MALVTIRPKYPRMLPGAELRGLAVALSEIDPTLDVVIDDSPVEHRVCVAFHEVIVIVGPWIAGPVVTTLVHVVIGWAKQRFAEKKHKRPKQVTLYGADNRILARVKVDPDAPPSIWTSDK